MPVAEPGTGAVAFGSLVGDPAATALIVIDMQRDFLLADAPVPAAGGMDLVGKIAELAQRCREAALPVVFTQEMHRADLSDFGIELVFEPPHCLEGSGGEEIVDGLSPQPGDLVVRSKRRYDAFLGTELDLLLRSRGIENLLFTGVCTDVCVLSSVQHARNLDYRCFVIEDAVAGTSPERHRAALMCMSHVFAYVGRMQEITRGFSLGPPEAA